MLACNVSMNGCSSEIGFLVISRGTVTRYPFCVFVFCVLCFESKVLSHVMIQIRIRDRVQMQESDVLWLQE